MVPSFFIRLLFAPHKNKKNYLKIVCFGLLKNEFLKKQAITWFRKSGISTYKTAVS